MKKHMLHKLFYTAVLAVAGSATVMAQGTISTIAGTGIAGLSGDGGLAVEARFSSPWGVAVDGSGNIFVADKMNNRIRKIDASGIITSYAGYGVPGWSPGTGSYLHNPVSVFVDASGEVLFTGWMNDMGYYTDPATGTTYARFGCGSQGSGGDGGPCLMAKTMTPTGSCEDMFGNTYVADYGSNRIRRIDAVTGIITTIVNGTGMSGYLGDGGDALAARTANPTAVFVDPSSPGAGHLYFADANNNVIRKVDLNTNIITTVAGTGVGGYSGDWGLATNARLRSPGSIFIDHERNMYICDRSNHAVRKMNLERKVISTIAGTGVAGFSGDAALSTTAQLNNPQGVWADNAGHVYIADAGNNRVRMVAMGVMPSTPKGGLSSTTDAVSVYPNPADGIFNISVGEAFANSPFTVLNVVGAQVAAGILDGQVASIDLSGLAAGTYTLMLSSSTGRHIEKLTIK